MEKTRWQQRLKNYTKELSQLEAFLKQESLNALEEQGLIQAFEYTHELAWKTQKSFLESRGVSDIFGSKDTTRQAFKLGLIKNGQVWMEMIKSRNSTSHTYNEATSQDIVYKIRHAYIDEFQQIHAKLMTFSNEE
jgi:nucleotidyltransferase substrate binding protein (TIGR01987 family)